MPAATLPVFACQWDLRIFVLMRCRRLSQSHFLPLHTQVQNWVLPECLLMFRTPSLHWRNPLGILAVLLCAYGVPAAAQSGENSLQTPRQALIEMFSGNAEKFRQHLTLEVQEKDALPGDANAVQAFASAISGSQNPESFDTGPILFSFNDPQQHQRREIHLDADDLRGDEDRMELSVHSFRSGIEEETPVHLRLHLDLILQQSIWRLKTVTATLEVPLSDPRTFETSWWMGPMLAGTAGPERAMVVSTAPPEQDPSAPDRPKMSALRAVRLITLAENLYAQRHPETGYTCAIANLVNVGKGLDETGTYDFLEPEFAGGAYNGYSFAIRGCEGKPARTFQVFAEPETGRGKAYCSDDRHNLRASDDGRGATCLAAGKIARQ